MRVLVLAYVALIVRSRGIAPARYDCCFLAENQGILQEPRAIEQIIPSTTSRWIPSLAVTL